MENIAVRLPFRQWLRRVAKYASGAFDMLRDTGKFFLRDATQAVVFFQFQHAESDRQIKAGTFLSVFGRARLIVILFSYGQRKPLLQMAEVTRYVLSLTAVPGNPTTAILSVLPHPA